MVAAKPGEVQSCLQVVLGRKLIRPQAFIEGARLPQSRGLPEGLIDSVLPPGTISLEVLQNVPVDAEGHEFAGGRQAPALRPEAQRRQAWWWQL